MTCRQICPSVHWNQVIKMRVWDHHVRIYRRYCMTNNVRHLYALWFSCSQRHQNYSAFKYFDFECTWWRLFQKRVVCTKQITFCRPFGLGALRVEFYFCFPTIYIFSYSGIIRCNIIFSRFDFIHQMKRITK